MQKPTQPPVPSDNDKGSPGMLGAATSADVAHQVQPDSAGQAEGPLRPKLPVKPTDSVKMMPPDIGGNG